MLFCSRIITTRQCTTYSPHSKTLLTKLTTYYRKPPSLLPSKRSFSYDLPRSSSHQRQEPILTEFVYGRKRIYTSLQTIGKTKAATASKGRIAAPVTTSPMSWEWIQPIIEDTSASKEKKKEWYQLETKPNSFSMFHSIKQNLREMFLPVGYPESVHDCYKKFHIWLFLETYVGSAIGVLCSQAMLASLGLGTMEATGGAVAIQWVLKDGIGEIGKLFFIKRYASSFDSHPKTWKFVSITQRVCAL
ncbi:MAG: vitamin B6 photo-protection and homoeostasis-domain-containing protein [Benjaminiella poitrasii]|nr:MAG: vitamin B6 photo-protection and homoeostasis-domain-containing protein [Benjaminiella poitrasii]